MQGRDHLGKRTRGGFGVVSGRKDGGSGERRGHPLLCMEMLYMTPGFSHSKGQESTEEEVTLVRHPVIEVKGSNVREGGSKW